MLFIGELRIKMGNNEKVRMTGKNGVELVLDLKNFAFIKLPKSTNHSHRNINLDLIQVDKYKKKK